MNTVILRISLKIHLKLSKRKEDISLEENKKFNKNFKKLVTLKDDVKLPIEINQLIFKPLDINKLVKFLDDMEFNKIKSIVISKFGINKENLKDESKELLEKSINAPKRDPIDKSKYELILDNQSLIRWCKVVESIGVVAIDCETTSLNAVGYKNCWFFDVMIENSKACYVPLNHITKDCVQINQKSFVEIIKKILEDESILKIGQNIKFDYIILKNLGII